MEDGSIPLRLPPTNASRRDEEAAADDAAAALEAAAARRGCRPRARVGGGAPAAAAPPALATSVVELGPELLPAEHRSLANGVYLALELRDAELVSLLLDALKAFGAPPEHELVGRATQFLVGSQREDGAWLAAVDADAPAARAHATVQALVALRQPPARSVVGQLPCSSRRSALAPAAKDDAHRAAHPHQGAAAGYLHHGPPVHGGPAAASGHGGGEQRRRRATPPPTAGCARRVRAAGGAQPRAPPRHVGGAAAAARVDGKPWAPDVPGGWPPPRRRRRRGGAPLAPVARAAAAGVRAAAVCADCRAMATLPAAARVRGGAGRLRLHPPEAGGAGRW